VIGAVEGWGRTVVHTDGNRYQKATVLGLLHSSPVLDQMERLRKVGLYYDVPVFSSSATLQEYVGQ